MTYSQQTTQHYTPHATLAAVGLKINALKLFDTVKEHVFIKQKTIKHTPVLDQRKLSIKRIVLNRAAPLVNGFLSALRALLLPQRVSIILDKI